MALTASQLAVVSRLLDEALPLDDVARTRWLATLPKEHEALKPALLELLRHTTSASSTGGADPLWQLERHLRAEPKIHHVGEVVGPYRLMRDLSRGELASTWLAARNEQKVTLKLPHAEAIDAGLGQRIVRERARLTPLVHPQIAHLLDTGWTEGGQPFIAFEHIEGTAIDAWCREQQLDVRARIRVFRDVVQAVAAIHAHNIVHGDIQPANVVVTREGKIKLLNTGLARILAGSAHRSASSDLRHAAPEQASGGVASVLTETYSLGVLLYETLCERAPYSSMTRERRELEDAILHQDPPAPSRIAKDPRAALAMRGALDTIVLKALAKEPAQRYPTAAAFAAALDRYLGDHGEAAHQSADIYTRLATLWRNRTARIALAVLLACLVGLGLVLVL